MKTPSKFLIGALAVAFLPAWLHHADGAVFGYVNQPITNGYNLVSNPLSATTNNLSNVIPTCPAGTQVYVWDVPGQDFVGPSSFDGVGWSAEFDLPPGKGFVILSGSKWTNTFVGFVLQGLLTNLVAGGNKFSLLGSQVPQAAPLSGLANLQFPAADGDNVYLFQAAAGSQSFSDAFTDFNGFGWFDPRGLAGTNGPVLQVSQAFFVQHPGPDTIWVRNFTVQLAAVPQSLPASQPSGDAAEVRSIAARGGTVTLSITNPTGWRFSTQFSTDGLSWKTVGTNQTGTTWTGPLASAAQGYYRVTSP